RARFEIGDYLQVRLWHEIAIFSSRSTSMARVGVCTRPTESGASNARPYARDRFMPTSQSARLRPNAACARLSYSCAGRSFFKPVTMAFSVSEEIHRRETGRRHLAAS